MLDSIASWFLGFDTCTLDLKEQTLPTLRFLQQVLVEESSRMLARTHAWMGSVHLLHKAPVVLIDRNIEGNYDVETCTTTVLLHSIPSRQIFGLPLETCRCGTDPVNWMVRNARLPTPHLKCRACGYRTPRLLPLAKAFPICDTGLWVHPYPLISKTPIPVLPPGQLVPKRHKTHKQRVVSRRWSLCL
jgi:hypothetical protein